MRTYVSAKLHGIRVTDASVDYHGSVGISSNLLWQASIEPYEQVHVVNLANGNRWVTYALPLEQDGQFTLNGGGAYLGAIGDRCVVMTYTTCAHFDYAGARVLFFDEHNVITDTQTYRP